MDVGHLPHRVRPGAPRSHRQVRQPGLTFRAGAGPPARPGTRSERPSGPSRASTSGRASHSARSGSGRSSAIAVTARRAEARRAGRSRRARPPPAGRPARPGPATAAAACPGSRPAARPGAGPPAASSGRPASSWATPRNSRPLATCRGAPECSARSTAPCAAATAASGRSSSRATSARTQPSRTRWRHQSGRPSASAAASSSRAGRGRAVAEPDRVGGQPEQRVEPASPVPPRALQRALVVALGHRVPAQLAVHAGHRGLAERAQHPALGARRHRPTRGSRTSSAPPYRPAEARQTPSSQPGRGRLGGQPLGGGRGSTARRSGSTPAAGPAVERRPLAGGQQPREVVRHACPSLRCPASPPARRREATVRAPAPADRRATTASTADSQVRARRCTPGGARSRVPARAAEQQHGRRPDRGQRVTVRQPADPGRRRPAPRGRPPSAPVRDDRVDQRPGRQPGAEQAGSRPGARPARRPARPAAAGGPRARAPRAAPAGRCGPAGRRPVTARSAASAHSLSRCSTSTPDPVLRQRSPTPASTGSSTSFQVRDHAGLRQAGPQQRGAGVAVQPHRGPGQPARGRAGVAGRRPPGRRPARARRPRGRRPPAASGRQRVVGARQVGRRRSRSPPRAASAAPTPCSISRRIRVSRARSAAV